MAKYTGHLQKWIDSQIESHLSAISKECIKQIPSLHSIILTGGFSRGEGSVLLEEKKVKPLNDYDIYIVTDYKIPENKLNEIIKNSENSIGSKGYSIYNHSGYQEVWADIRCIPYAKIPKLLPLIKYYEIKNSSKLLYGENVLPMFPEISEENLPKADALRFLFNRMSHITEWLLLSHFSNSSTKWQKQLLIYNCIKARLECNTALCILLNQFSPSYSGRLEILKKNISKFPELLKENPKLLQEIEFAVKQKKTPRFEKINPLKFHDKTRKLLFLVSNYFLKKAFNSATISQASKKYLSTYSDMLLENSFIPKNFLTRKISYYLMNFVLKISWTFRVLKHKNSLKIPLKEPGIQIFETAQELLSSIDLKGNISEQKLSIARKTLSKLYPIPEKQNSTEKEFELLRKNFTDAWKLYYFQKVF